MIWWWQFGCNGGSTPDYITKFGWEVYFNQGKL